MSKRVNGPSLLDKMWDALDTATQDIMISTLAGDDLTLRKGYARGMAEAIRILSTPVFHSTDAVVSCAVTRYGTDAAFTGSPAIIHHAPPDGIISGGELAAQAPAAAGPNPAPGTDANPITVPSSPYPTAPPVASEAELSPAQREGITAALASGLTAEAVAGAFAVEQHVVEMISREQS